EQRMARGSASTLWENSADRCWPGACGISSESLPSPHHLAAVEVDGLAGSEGRRGRAEESDEAGHFLVGGGAAHGDAVELLLPAVAAAEHGHAPGVDGARADGVDDDAGTRHFDGQRLRQALDAELR